MKKFFLEFREFAMRGNVLDMAVGVLIGSAFGKITTSLVNDVFMPLLGMLVGGMDFSELNITLKQAVMDGETVVTPAVVVGIGSFISTVVDFLLMAFAVFVFIRFFNRLRRKKEEAPAAPAAPPAPTSEELLTEIRDLLKEQQK